MFDVSKLDTKTLSETGQAMPILNPKTAAPFLDGDGKPVTITLLGPNSAKAKGLQRATQARRADMQARGIVLTADDLARERFELLVAVTVGWTFTALDDKPFLFSADNVRLFWADPRWDWLAFDAWRFCNADGNYLPS